jgi:hypothetical protein
MEFEGKIYHEAIYIKPLDNYILYCEFENGEKRKYDMKPLIESDTIIIDGRYALRDFYNIPGLFEQVKIYDFGLAVMWNDDLDLDVSTIYYYGEEVL